MREKTYAMLVKNMDEYISGEAISGKLGVSRAAVLKHIHIFQQDGAVIHSVNNKGHRLISYADRLKSEYVMPLMKDCPANIVWYETVGSTNIEAKTLAIEGAKDFTCVTAEEQTGGRGRMGRSWASPKYKNIYFSAVLRPDIKAEDALGITVLAALAVCRALRMNGLPALIKWPNDVLVNGKKICGILTEISANMDGVEYIVCGIGVNTNVTLDELPEDLQAVATSVLIEKGAATPRTKLFADVLCAFWEYYESFKKNRLKDLIAEYSEFSALHGKTVTLITAKETLSGCFAGFDEQAALLVEIGGEVKKFIAGEISLRGF